jgi:CspA family cold shock protein
MKPLDLAEAMRWLAAGPHPRERGWVLWFKAAKGHGRIKADNDDQVLFVLFGHIRGEGFRTLQKGQRVEFTRTASPDGWHAEDVVVLPDPSPTVG